MYTSPGFIGMEIKKGLFEPLFGVISADII